MFLESALWIGFAVVIPSMVLFSSSKKRAVIVGNENDEGSRIRRSPEGAAQLVDSPDPAISTTYDILVLSSRTFANQPLMGARSVVRIVEEEKEVTKMVGGVQKTEKKTWKFFELSKYDWMTAAKVGEMAHQIGAGLKYLGLKPLDKMTLFASTSREWMLMAFGCASQSITITTAYDTLGADGLAFSLNECDISTLFTSVELFDVVDKIAPSVKTLKTVIYMGSPGTAVEDLKKKHAHLRLISIEEVRQLGVQYPADPKPPKKEDLACIMYTSGSTGNPKGVVLTHGNVVAAVAGAKAIVATKLNSEDYYLAYLPLAHILEFLVECTLIHLGVRLGYGSPKTLTDISVRNCFGDIKELRPTIMAGVPSVWETIRKGIMTKVGMQPPLKQKIFDFICSLKWSLMQNGIPSSFLDFAFKPIKENTGGRLKMAVSGGAPIARETHQFLSTVLCPIVQGYGMTESCGLIAIQHADQSENGILGQVGPPGNHIEIKLVDVPDTNYSTKNSPNPQGEIFVRGPSITSGYFKQPKVTAETFSSDGWLMTGDIGEWQPDGSLCVIDRRKNLVKLAHGEYIALEYLESVYKTCSSVLNICVYADPEKSYAVAIIVPALPNVEKYLKGKGVIAENVTLEIQDLSNYPEAKEYIMHGLLDVAKKTDLKPAEKLGDICLSAIEWTPQNELLTAAMKLKRKDINKKFQAEIQNLYAKAK